jgi:hypothetical protein
VQYIKDYEAAGITIDFIGFLNEPEFALVQPKGEATLSSN